jgi:hypothetical protein
MGYGLWAMGYGLWAMGYGLWAMGYGLWAMGYGLWAMGYGLWALGYGLQYGLWAMASRFTAETLLTPQEVCYSSKYMKDAVSCSFINPAPLVCLQSNFRCVAHYSQSWRAV